MSALHLQSRACGRRGFMLMELLVGLTISATLLTAIGVSLNACLRSYSITQVQSDMTERARVALSRICSYVRSGTSHQPYTGSAATTFAAGTVTSDVGISLVTDDGITLAFHYDAPTQRLLLRENGKDYEMVRGVQSFSVVLEPMKSPTSLKTGGVYDWLLRATFTLTMANPDATDDVNSKMADQTLTISSSAIPRANVW